LNWKFIKE